MSEYLPPGIKRDVNQIGEVLNVAVSQMSLTQDEVTELAQAWARVALAALDNTPDREDEDYAKQKDTIH